MIVIKVIKMDSVVNLEKDGKKFSYNIKDIFHSINAFDADEYLQTEGYFANTMDGLARAINEGEKRVLTEIEDETYEHRFMSDEEDHYHYQFFLPVSKVNVIKPTYRPFQSIVEFCSFMGIQEGKSPIGLILTIRHKESKETYSIQVAGFSQKKLVIPVFGCLSFFNLFKNWELMHNSTEFTPFGVLVTEGEKTE